MDDDYNSLTPGWGVDHFNKIQDGINAASDGDTVYVYNGIFYEKNVLIKKSIKLIGENTEKTIIDANREYHVIFCYVSNISIQYFTIRNSHPEGTGILLTNSNNCKITNNDIHSNYYGIKCVESDNNIISNNIISSNNIGIGISSQSSFNTFKDNEIKFNVIGIDIQSSNNKINNNTFIENQNGLYISAQKNGLSYNILKDNDVGIFFDFTGDLNSLSYNEFLGNASYGIKTSYPPAPTLYILHNTFSNNNFFVYTNLYLYENENGWENNYWSNWWGFDYDDYGELLINTLNQLYNIPVFSILINIITDIIGYPSPPYLGPFYKIPGAPEGLSSQFNTYYNIDWNPAKEPYEIEIYQ
ncbi:MAG: right-handed parallel beta-helix repeat-containing protein [Candidatus Thermoplasmatota archaeon]|nr:right-handed parallel beta-helix repeat-containing protein [Candidatus Thermoplasmatota archaeon]